MSNRARSTRVEGVFPRRLGILFTTLFLGQPAKLEAIGMYRRRQTFTHERDAFTVPLATRLTRVELLPAT